MQTKPEQITPTFAPEMQFNVELISRTTLAEPIGQSVASRFGFFVSQEKLESRGVRFSALND